MRRQAAANSIGGLVLPVSVPQTVIAIDWSGAMDPRAQRRGIQTAVCDAATGSVRVEGGRLRSEIEAWLRSLPGPVVAGLDFSFSFPAWFLRELGCGSAPELWAQVARDGERWLREGHSEFWGRRKGSGPPPGRDGFRACERGVTARSSFQIGGAGAVGTGSLRGMPMLGRLRAAGWRVWPFDSAGERTLIEIYPRLLTGPVVKSRLAARIAYLRAPCFDGLASEARAAAEAGEDALDALVSALRMREHAGELARFQAVISEPELLEGAIWRPGLSVA